MREKKKELGQGHGASGNINPCLSDPTVSLDPVAHLEFHIAFHSQK